MPERMPNKRTDLSAIAIYYFQILIALLMELFSLSLCFCGGGVGWGFKGGNMVIVLVLWKLIGHWLRANVYI